MCIVGGQVGSYRVSLDKALLIGMNTSGFISHSWLQLSPAYMKFLPKTTYCFVLGLLVRDYCHPCVFWYQIQDLEHTRQVVYH